MYRTVCSDLSDLSDVKYNLLVFYSPSGIESLFKKAEIGEKSEIQKKLNGRKVDDALLTLHRRSDVDEKKVL